MFWNFAGQRSCLKIDGAGGFTPQELGRAWIQGLHPEPIVNTVISTPLPEWEKDGSLADLLAFFFFKLDSHGCIPWE